MLKMGTTARLDGGTLWVNNDSNNGVVPRELRAKMESVVKGPGRWQKDGALNEIQVWDDL